MGEVGTALAVIGLLVWLITLSGFDIRQRRLPDRLTLPGAVVILAGATITGNGLAAALGGVALFVGYAAVHLIAPAAIGAGDVKLAIGLGALAGTFGADVWILATLGASLLTALLAVCYLLCGAGSSVPHGPSMCLATGAAVAMAVM